MAAKRTSGWLGLEEERYLDINHIICISRKLSHLTLSNGLMDAMRKSTKNLQSRVQDMKYLSLQLSCILGVLGQGN